MKIITLLLFTALLASLCVQAQDSSRIHEIDSIVAVYGKLASTQSLKIVEGSLLLNDNKTKSVRFFREGKDIRMLIVEDNNKDSVELFFLQGGKLIFTGGFTHGDLNEFDHTVYFIDDKAYLKQKNSFLSVDKSLWTDRIKWYFDFFKE